MIKTNNTIGISFPSSDQSFRISGSLHLPPDISDKSRNNKKVNNIQQKKKKKYPAVLIINGSGPVDRNGNISGRLMGLKLNTSLRLAHHFSTQKLAMAALTYDKRGVAKSKKKGDKNFYYRAGVMDFVSDAVQAIRFLLNHPLIDRDSLFLCGHSEGAILLPLIMERLSNNADGDESLSSDAIKGCIFLAGFGESIVMAKELKRERLLAEIEDEGGMKGYLLRKIITKKRFDNSHYNFLHRLRKKPDREYFSLHGGLIKQPARWFRDYMELESRMPSIMAEQMTCHVLAITGGMDLQVRSKLCDPKRAAMIVPKAASLETHRPVWLNHILRSFDDDDYNSNHHPKLINARRDYGRMGKQPLDSELLGIIDKWVDRVLLFRG